MDRKAKQAQLRHLYRRAGFGISTAQLEKLDGKSREFWVKNLFAGSQNPEPLTVVDNSLLAERKEMVKALPDKTREERRQMARDLFKESREKIKDLNLLWISRMASGESVLREKMTLFWHGHFACQNGNAFFVQQQNNLLRRNALGNFKDLLTAVSKDAAMLNFLNNRQNRKDRPNENFAREVMELFTLGRGNYSENDVKNAAKAFTGWNFDANGNFFLNQRQHDEGEKTFFGKTGNLPGEAVLQMILENKQTARFITQKIYRYFVNDEPDEKIIKGLAENFYQSGYEISVLMKEIFMADWFYDNENVGCRIKSPVELLAGLQLAFGLQFEDPQSVLFVQKTLGQVLFYPPNVAGWKEGKSWIDSSSLMFRLRLPEIIFRSAQINVAAKADGDVNTDYLAKNKSALKVTADWTDFSRQFQGIKDQNLPDALAETLLALPLSDKQRTLLQNQPILTERLKDLTISLLTLPEYQMC
jgi:uncharacterized protein (DUF1800 family)